MEATGCLEIAAECYTDIEAVELARWHIFDVCLAGGNLTNGEFDEALTPSTHRFWLALLASLTRRPLLHHQMQNMVAAKTLNKKIDFIHAYDTAYNVLNVLLQKHMEKKKQKERAMPKSVVPYQAPPSTELALVSHPTHGPGSVFVKRHALDTPEKHAQDLAKWNQKEAEEAQRKQEEHEEWEREREDKAAEEKAARKKREQDDSRKMGWDDMPEEEVDAEAEMSRTSSAARAKEAGDKAKAKRDKEKREQEARQIAWEKEIEKVFHRTDKNQDGFLSRAEIIRALKTDIKLAALLELQDHVSDSDDTHRKFETAFQDMDNDVDRHIAYAEFLKFCAKIHPDFQERTVLLERTRSEL